MSFSDSDLMMVENLTYLMKGTVIEGTSFEPTKTNFKPLRDCDTVAEYLGQFDEDMLTQMDKKTGTKYSGEISGSEWAAMIRYMKSNSQIRNLKIADYNDDVGAICFVSQDGEAIVSFRGTTGKDEWVDNVEGLNCSDTKSQQEALDYINSLPYNGITVTGHSKGGNKAQYVTICAEEGKIKQCISMDGQGFSQEFLDKYGHIIQERASLIKNYSLRADFVNILLFPVPGAEQIYIDGGKDVGSLGENHSPNAFFEYYLDENGHWILVVAGGAPVLGYSTGGTSDLAVLQDFIAFFLNNASDEDKKIMVSFLSELLGGVMGEEWELDRIIQYLMTNQDGLALFLAYFIKYIEVFDISQADAIALLDSLGISDAVLIALGLTDHFMNVGDFVEFIYKNLTDGKRDWIIETLLKWAGGATGVDIEGLWKKIEETYGELDDVKKDASKGKIEIYDYSIECYNQIMESIRAFRSGSLPRASSWNDFSGFSWFNKLLVSVVVRCINSYSEKVDTICNNWERKTNERFEEVWTADRNSGEKVKNLAEKIAYIETKVKVNLLD